MVAVAGISVILTQAAKAKDEESVGRADEISGSEKVRNCPEVMVTALF